MNMDTVRRLAHTESLDVHYEQTGPDDGVPVVLLHGFPYDVRQYDDVVRLLAKTERRIVVPYLRGFGPTRYRSADVVRSGQQAALGKDLIDLLDALGIERAVVGGYDWGGRAACVAAALWPKRVAGLLSASGYAIQDIAKAATTSKPPDATHMLWYQSYFNTTQGETGLEADRRAICKYLWQTWSPSWAFTDEAYSRTADSFDNPDFVATVIQSYRHRYANAPGDPALEALEARLARAPAIGVPTVAIHGGDDGVDPPSWIDGHERHFTGPYRAEVIAGVGHCVPAEAPRAFADALESLLASPNGAGIGGLDRFDYMVKDVERAIAFYRNLFGRDVSSRGATGAEFVLPDGACFGLWSDVDVPFQPSNGAMFHVADVDRALAYLATRGVEPADEMTTKVCRFATFADPEGNTFALHRRHDAH